MNWRRAGLIALLVLVGVAWLAFGKDPTRERFIHSLSEVADRTVASRTSQANWGDVAKKVGDFAAEERGLRDSVSRAEAAQPPPGR
jgi:hypothetical protein